MSAHNPVPDVADSWRGTAPSDTCAGQVCWRLRPALLAHTRRCVVGSLQGDFVGCGWPHCAESPAILEGCTLPGLIRWIRQLSGPIAERALGVDSRVWTSRHRITRSENSRREFIRCHNSVKIRYPIAGSCMPKGETSDRTSTNTTIVVVPTRTAHSVPVTRKTRHRKSPHTAPNVNQVHRMDVIGLCGSCRTSIRLSSRRAARSR